jgi:hypothetical protein
MNENPSKQIIVVLGAGRTGTSLIMQALNELGMTVSENMTPASEQNPYGAYEDLDILAIQTDIFKSLNTKPKIPLPDDWLLKTDVNGYVDQLCNVIIDRINGSPTIFGFKDPRTAVLLPLWFKVFNRVRIVPKYILSVRNPSASVRSLISQYHFGESISELFWLHKNCSALAHTGGNCFIVHYEDWFIRPHDLSKDLLQYTGLERYVSGNVDDALAGVIDVKLNRSVYDEYVVQNKYVLRLYEALKNCSGYRYDRDILMSVVKASREAMNGFKGWYLEAHNYLDQEKNVKDKLKSQKEAFNTLKEQYNTLKSKFNVAKDELKILREESSSLKNIDNDKKIAQMETDLQHLVEQNNRLLIKYKDLSDQSEAYRNEIAVVLQRRCNKQALSGKQLANKWKRELISLKYSSSFKLGQILINAIKKPGRNTLLMPYHLVKLAIDRIFGRENENMNTALKEIK